MASSTTAPSFDCSQLLSLCAIIEQDAFHFGHPPPPHLEMVQYNDNDIVVVIARTVHGICTHIIVDGDASNTKPSVLLKLRNDDERDVDDRDDEDHDGNEEITALRLVQVTPNSTDASTAEDSNSNQRNNKSSFASMMESTISSSAKKKQQVLLVCVGTSASRFFCIQVTVAATGFKTSAPWQPFPLHTPGLFSYSSSDGCGVMSIVSWVEDKNQQHQNTYESAGRATSITYVFVSYGDGTMFRIMAHALLKPETNNDNDDASTANLDENDKKGGADRLPFLKVQTLLPNHDSTYTVIPCRACPSHWIHDEVPGHFSALVYPNSANASAGLGDVQPTLTAYTSRDHSLPQHPQLREQTKLNNSNTDDQHNNPAQNDDHDDFDHMRKDGDSELLNVAIDATSALIRGVSGMVKWGWRQGNKATAATTKKKHKQKKKKPRRRPGHDDGDNDSDQEDEDTIHFPRAYQPATVQLTATTEVHDAPRHLHHVQVVGSSGINSSSEAAILTDTLGRVQWMELEQHFTITRLWKGHRDATCIPLSTTRSNGNTALVIYSGQRKSLEVWQLYPQQQRIVSRQLGRDAQVVRCVSHQDGNATPLSCCFLLEVDGRARATMLSELVVDMNTAEPVIPGSPSGGASVVSLASTTVPQHRSVSPGGSVVTASPSVAVANHDAKLQMLQQMLSNTNVPHTQSDVFRIFSQITNLQHLCQALDLLAVTPDNTADFNRQDGSVFARQCLQHCRAIYEKTTANQTADVTQSPPVLELEGKIQLHTQLIAAFDALHTFQLQTARDDANGNNDEEADARINAKSAWAIEGMAWFHTSDTIVNGHSDMNRIKPVAAPSPLSTTPISFARFCQCCNIAGSTIRMNANNGDKKYSVLLSDSSRTRREFLAHIFAPLLKDAFHYKVVSTIVEELGLKEVAVQQFLGEWFMTIPPAVAAHKAFFALYSPISRWIQDLVATKVDALIEANQPLPHIVLSELHSFCSASDDLVPAFLLAAACRECISAVIKKREAKTYGKVWKSQAVQPWDELLRKIRVCLLLSLRLYGIPLGPFPITVKHIEDGSIFSIYELVARDELACSHKHAEIVALERACKDSGVVFDPSSPVGDNPSRWRVLQQACLASAISEAERAEYLVELEAEVQGALLLYLSHYNNPPLLCAHRALLLAQQWIEEPKRVELLRDCLDALAALDEDMDYAGAIRLEIWQTCIRPVFRAFLFGFDDVQEIQEDVYYPLMQNVDWMVRMGKAGLSILSLIEKSVFTKRGPAVPLSPPDATSGWPVLGADSLLQSLVHKFRPVNQNALDVHRVIVSGCMVSSDVHTLSECVEGFYEAFVSLYQPSGAPGGDSEKQLDFLEQAIISRAENLHKPILDRFDLDEIETLALLWSIDVRDVRTIFLLAMYEFGKDTVVDDLLTRMSSQRGMDLNRFLEDGIGIVCRRLHQMLHIKRSHEIRSLLGLLDADTTEWIRDQAEGTFSLLEDDNGADRVVLDVPLQSTHVFVLRLMSIAISHADKDTRVKLHSLSILTGTLLKELEREQD